LYADSARGAPPSCGIQKVRAFAASACSLRFRRRRVPCYDKVRARNARATPKGIQLKEVNVADTKKIADKAERKKLKRTARKKAAPKAKRTVPRGSQKKKVKKMVRGQSKR
jgi:hypothetical protein